MNTKVREVTLYRAIFYLPSILPVFAISFIFVVLLNPGYGLVNWLLSSVGLPSPNWLGDPAYTKLALVMIAQLGAGQWALVFLAGLRGIPTDLYESASIDGAGRAYRELHAQGRELRFALDPDGGPVQIEVRDLDGNVLRRIPPTELLDVATGAPLD